MMNATFFVNPCNLSETAPRQSSRQKNIPVEKRQRYKINLFMQYKGFAFFCYVGGQGFIEEFYA